MKYFTVEFPDGETWGVPISYIVGAYSAHKSHYGEFVLLEEVEKHLMDNPEDMAVFVQEELTWRNVQNNAVKLYTRARNFAEEWSNGKWEIFDDE